MLEKKKLRVAVIQDSSVLMDKKILWLKWSNLPAMLRKKELSLSSSLKPLYPATQQFSLIRSSL